MPFKQNHPKHPNSSKGQVVLLLLVVMTVALAVVLAAVQRSLRDISTSNIVEESSRAFSAAEAGIERAVRDTSGGGSKVITVDPSELGNNSTASVWVNQQAPAREQARESLLTKEQPFHLWFSRTDGDLTDSAGIMSSIHYARSFVDIYWGSLPADSNSDKWPALEINVISWNGTQFISTKKYLDPNPSRRALNNFEEASPSNNSCPHAINTMFSSSPGVTDRRFCWHYRFSSLPANLIMLRARLLYSDEEHSIAVKPDDSCPNGPDPAMVPCSFPYQTKLYLSVGSSGDTERVVILDRTDKVLPFFFDYAIFSTGEIVK